MNYSLIRNFSSADGEGLRTSVYFSGCQRALEGNACIGCHNSQAWKQDAGNLWTDEIKKVVLDSIEPNYVQGLSILGGEPLSDFNLEGVIDLAKSCKETFNGKKDVWMWTGYNLDEALADPKKSEKVKELLKYLDYIIDGPFVQELKNPELKFRGSSNQRILHIENGSEIVDVTEEIESK